MVGMEPDWEDVKGRLLSLTVKQLRAIGRRWFNGSLGGASSKLDIAGEMVSCMRHWWHLADDLGKPRVGNVLKDLADLEA